MGRFLFIAFLVMPLLELYAIVQVAGIIDTLPTIGLLLLVSMVGAWLVKTQGFSLLARINADISGGKMPTHALIDGAMVVLGGALLLTPGFITDGIGLAFQLPPVRAMIRPLITRSIARRVEVRTAASGLGGMFAGGSFGGPGGPGGPGGEGSGSPFGAAGFGGPGFDPTGAGGFGRGRTSNRHGDFIDAEVISDEPDDGRSDGRDLGPPTS